MKLRFEPMELSEDCIRFTGQRIYAKPHYGWGWSREEAEGEPHQSCEPPLPIYMRVHRFFQHNGVLRGAVGVVEEPGYVLDGFWTVLYSRVVGVSDLTQTPVLSNMFLCPEEPTYVSAPGTDTHPPERYWPKWERHGFPQLGGYGVVAETAQHIEAWEKRGWVVPQHPQPP